MPPKHKFGKKHRKTQSRPRTQSIQSSASDKHIVHSTNQNSLETNNESSLDSHSITSTDDVLTVTSYDRRYCQISKQTLQYEMKRKRLTVPTIPEQDRLENDETSLPASIMSDCRLILQDSITIEDLREGCISLFDQVNSKMNLSQNEMNHAVRFLEYACIHIKYRKRPSSQLIETIFPKEKDRQTSLVSSLINLLSLPSDTLRTVILSFFDAGLSKTTRNFSVAVAVTGLFPQLFSMLKPHEIPLSDATMEFHHHVTSILDDFFTFSTPSEIRRHLKIGTDPSRVTNVESEIITPFFKIFCSYLRYIIATPFFGEIGQEFVEELVSMMDLPLSSEAEHFLHSDQTDSTKPDETRLFYELRKNMTIQLATSLTHATPEALNSCLIDEKGYMTGLLWIVLFERLLVRMSEGQRFSDLGIHAFRWFMSRVPCGVYLVFSPDGTFSLNTKETIVSTSKLESKTLWALFTPTQLHHADTILTAFLRFMNYTNTMAFVRHIWTEWFPLFMNAVGLSTLPFTFDFITLHANVVALLKDHLTLMHEYDDMNQKNPKNELRNELDDLYRSFYNQTKEYVIHLSLHPFALDDAEHETILDFLSKSYLFPFKSNLNKPYLEEVRREMDEFAVSSSAPPFILTSELVCPLPDADIVNVVDRIVALIGNDSCLDDDTILRICAFHKRQLKSVFLPELFRKAGRTTEQYYHTINSILSLHIECLDQAPISSLLSTQPFKIHSNFDEWDDVHLETVGIVKRTLNQNQLSDKFESKAFDSLIIDFVIQSLPRAIYSVYRLCQPRLERLIAPSVDFLGPFFIRPREFDKHEGERRAGVFLNICELCSRRKVALCLSRTGFFARFVAGLFNDNFDASVFFFSLIVDRDLYYHIASKDKKKLRGTVPNFLEEGWQDVLEYIFVKKDLDSHETKYGTLPMMRYLGANFDGKKCWYVTD
ncbi:hypothetical protein BLNAU_11969 [Blattamonas nauphoetae]|uniref:Uncharacterized protein n=1 Tax=Blattamonas nauphoetae TaxID=2049346 RepID=A0ABQ9XP52_9EUKA|nr:hypothetical protein BLNAU_11969 [Blattamonas nauphoetae]